MYTKSLWIFLFLVKTVAKSSLFLGTGLYVTNADLEYAHFAYPNRIADILREDINVLDVHLDKWNKQDSV